MSPDFVGEDAEQRPPHLLARLVVRRARLGRVECLDPVVGAHPDVAPLGRDIDRRRGRLLIERDGGPHRLHQLGRRLQPGHGWVCLYRRGGAFDDEVAQRAGLHALLTETWQDVGNISQIRLMRTDEQHSPSVVTESWIGVEQVRRAMQRDDGLAGARPTVDNERAM